MIRPGHTFPNLGTLMERQSKSVLPSSAGSGRIFLLQLCADPPVLDKGSPRQSQFKLS